MIFINALKHALILCPVFAVPKSTDHMTLDTNARNVQIGWVLQQQQPEKTTKPIKYWSRSLTDTEREYSTMQRECLAIVWSVILLRPYLKRTRFTILTEHASLRFIFNFFNGPGRRASWSLQLSEFEVDVFHCRKIHHEAANAPSLRCTLNENTIPLDYDLNLPTIDRQDENSSHVCVINMNSDDVTLLNARSDASLNSPPMEGEFVVTQRKHWTSTLELPHSK